MATLTTKDNKPNKAEEPTPNPPSEQIGSFHRRGSPLTLASKIEKLLKRGFLCPVGGFARFRSWVWHRGFEALTGSKIRARDFRACGCSGSGCGQSDGFALFCSAALARLACLGSGIGHWLWLSGFVAVIREPWE